MISWDLFLPGQNKVASSQALIHHSPLISHLSSLITQNMEITVQQLKEKLNSGDKFLLLDVREPWEFEEFNLGGQLMPVGDLMNKMWELEDQKEAEIVVHCRSGARSAMAQGLLMANGFKNVRNLKGGVIEWEAVFGKGVKP